MTPQQTVHDTAGTAGGPYHLPDWLMERWHLKPGTFWCWRARGKLTGLMIRIGDRLWRVDEAAVLRYEAAARGDGAAER